MMDDGHGSKRKKKKKKRGKSLIFKNFFKPASSGDDPSSDTGGKVLASDDNLIYCDVSGNCVDPDIKKSSSSRMSRIFKAVLFDTAVKKKIHGNDSSETPLESGSSSPVRDEKIENVQKTENIGNIEKMDKTEKIEKIDKIEKNEKTDKIEKIENLINENNSDVVKESEVDHTSTDRSNQLPLPPKPAESPVSSSPITTVSQMLTERKVNPVDKKPPLPSNPRPPAKPVPVEENKHVASNNPTVRLRLYILLGFLVLVAVVLWKIYAAIKGAFSSDIDSDQSTKTAIAGDEL